MASLQIPQTPCLTHFWCTASCCVAQIKDAVRDGLRAVKNVIDDKAVVLGAGAFEVAAAQHLRESVKKQVGSKDCHAYPVLESLANIASIDGCMLAVWNVWLGIAWHSFMQVLVLQQHCKSHVNFVSFIKPCCIVIVLCGAAGARQGQAGCGGICRGPAGLCEDPSRKQRVGGVLARQQPFIPAADMACICICVPGQLFCLYRLYGTAAVTMIGMCACGAAGMMRRTC